LKTLQKELAELTVTAAGNVARKSRHVWSTSSTDSGGPALSERQARAKAVGSPKKASKRT
jgi:hypothetical protein